MPDTKITIGVLSQGTVKMDMASSLVMAVCATYVPIHMMFYQGAYVHDSRNKIVEEVIKEGSTHLMFIDHDMVFPENGISILLSRNKDIIGGCYNMRGLPLRTTVMVPINENESRLLNPNEVPKEPFRCSVVPAGFMLINTDVFKKMPTPYFSFDPLDKRLVGEDVYFCRKANKLGIEVWCDPTIRIGHVGDYAY